MRSLKFVIILPIVLGLDIVAHAQPPAVTAICKDGTPYAGSQRSGACSHHGGVQTWGAAAPQVWVNTASKVYHCPGDVEYGKTKAGAYMTEAAAKASGDHPARGKACS